jgi:N-acetylglutamate synthase
MYDHDLLMRIERASVRAWPALETSDLDGWLWRYSDGGSQRANSVSTLSYTGRDIQASIDEVEHRYGARGGKAMFQVSDVSVPAGLDAELGARGYGINDACITLVKTIEGASVMPAGMAISETATTGWFDCYASVITPSRRHIAPLILARVPAPRAFFALVRDSTVVATALGVAHDGIAIVECVATLAEARGTGAASAVLRGLEAWAAGQGCVITALQAVAANGPAQALYRSLGYRVHGRYHMRVQAQPRGGGQGYNATAPFRQKGPPR